MASGQSWAAFKLSEALFALLPFSSSLPIFTFPFTIIVISLISSLLLSLEKYYQMACFL